MDNVSRVTLEKRQMLIEEYKCMDLHIDAVAERVGLPPKAIKAWLWDYKLKGSQKNENRL